MCFCVCLTYVIVSEIDLADEEGPERSAEGLFCKGLGTVLL